MQISKVQNEGSLPWESTILIFDSYNSLRNIILQIRCFVNQFHQRHRPERLTTNC